MNSTISYIMKHMDSQNSYSKYKKMACQWNLLQTILKKKEESKLNGPCYSYDFITHTIAIAAATWARIDNWEKGGMWSTNIKHHFELPHIVKITLHKFHNLFYCWKYWRPYDDTHTISHSYCFSCLLPHLYHDLSLSLPLCVWVLCAFAVWFRYSNAIAYSHAMHCTMCSVHMDDPD